MENVVAGGVVRGAHEIHPVIWLDGKISLILFL